jgi:hypothetical protein
VSASSAGAAELSGAGGRRTSRPGGVLEGLPGRPLTCRKCGGTLKVIAYLHDTVSIRRILEHLGLGQPEEERPPRPDIRYVPVDEEGREIEAP